jgi:hypothetical protein
MANPRIEVEIGANVTDLSQGVNQATSQLDKLAGAANKTAPQINKLKNATSQYNSVGVDFARIIQDAPFGIIGVGNNITQLAGSFQQLKNSTGSTSQALKTAFASIFSSGNALILGISALTTVFTILQQQGFFKTEKSAESLSDALEEYRNKLDSVTKASIEGQANSQREVQSFALLRAQAENANIPLSTRLEAVKDLKKEYPEYLKGLTDEQILTGNVGTAYDQLTKSIVATAKARAFSDTIAKNSLDLLTIEQKAQQNVTDILNKQAKLAPLLAAQANQASKSRGEFTGLDLQILDLQKEIRDLQLDQVSNIENANNLKTENLSLESKITEQISNGAKFTSQQNESIKDNILTLEEFTKKWNANEDAILRNLQAQRKLQVTQNSLLEISFGKLTGKEGDVAFADPIADLQNKIAMSLSGGAPIKEFADTFKKTGGEIKSLVDELSGAFAGLGSLIGKAFDNPQLGSFLGQFIAFAAKLIATNFTIASSNAAVGASSAAVATGPAAPFTLPAFLAASLGLIAGAFASFGGKKSSPSIGTSGVSGGMGTSFVGGGIAGLFNQNTEMNLVSIVRGNDIVLVSERAKDRVNKG